MEIAAATVSFIGLSGQILQGCNYLCKIFSDAKDAPEVISDISNELYKLRSQLEGFRLLLLKVQDALPATLTVQQDPAVSLQSCQDAIQKLQSFVDEYVDLSTPAGTNPSSSQTRRDALRKAWQKFDVARKGNKLGSHKSQLEVAKTSLLASQISIQIALELQHFDVTREVRRNLQQLQIEHTVSAQILQKTKGLATEIKTVQAENYLLTKMNKVSLDQVLSNGQMLLIQSASSDQSAHDARTAINRVEDVFKSHSADLKKEIDNLPTICGSMIQDSIEKSLARCNISQQAGIIPANQMSIAGNSRIRKANAYHESVSFFDEHTSQKAKSLHQIGHSLMTPLTSCKPCPVLERYTSPAGGSIQPKRRGPKRQHRSKSTYNFWFGSIEITSSTTEQEIEEDSDYIPPMSLQARQTTFKLIPSTWFLKISLLFESGVSRPTVAQPGWDNRLRFIRTHPYGSAVVKAIECADYLRFRQLFRTGEVRPFDIVESRLGWTQTLFDIVTQKFARSSKHSTMKGLLDIASLLADSGADAGGIGPALHHILFSKGGVLVDVAMSLFRIVMANSQSDPFEFYYIIRPALFEIDKHIRVIAEQDVWDVSEIRTSFQNYKGKGSWQYMLENESGYPWSSLQEQKWHQLPASLRRLKSYCLAEFGESFIRYDWGRLCWSDERPAFWNSRQACEEAFGSNFVENIWPSLYWKEEVPSFWRSREACEEFFGSSFVNNSWPSLYWKEEVPSFWGSRQACEEFFDSNFIEYTWPSLYWKEEVPSFWRSREACEEFFGSYFVECFWPDLYWRQELPTFWQSRKACLEFFGDGFVEREWPQQLGRTCFEFLEGKGTYGCFMNYSEWWEEHRIEWRSEMIERWWEDAPTIRRSRQYCIDQYGTSFVQDELPALLRLDGLPEEDVLRLTQYGPDMDPPRPYSYRGTEYESSSEPAESEVDGEESGESGGDSGGDSDGDNDDSDGWETADEG